MFLGEILVANGFVTKEQVEAALNRQRKHNGPLGENLIALGFITESDLKRALALGPPAPRDLRETGVSEQFLVNHMLKFMHVKALETPSQIAENLKLPVGIVTGLLQFAKDNALVQVLGASGLSMMSELRYDLTEQGRRRALEQMQRSQYLGPAPVPMEKYIAQIERQHLTNERIPREYLVSNLSHLVLPKRLIAELGPAANSAKAMLLYGPPGSGKTSVAEALGRAFKGLVYVPYAVELDGQIITIFDPIVHKPVEQQFDQGSGLERSLIRESFDSRWVLCRRPTVMTGGELRMDLLDLKYNREGGLYEAPLQIKAMNGIFIIDDFGRQLVNPRDLLNRWIVPLESRFDFLHLHTGRKFLVPFDVLIVFSTNLAPEDLMDEAFLRRIPYKILVGTPSVDDYVEIFERVCASERIAIPSGFVQKVLMEFYEKSREGVASYHPRFLIDRVIDDCRYRGELPHLDLEVVAAAWRNLFVEKTTSKPTAARA